MYSGDKIEPSSITSLDGRTRNRLAAAVSACRSTPKHPPRSSPAVAGAEGRTHATTRRKRDAHGQNRRDSLTSGSSVKRAVKAEQRRRHTYGKRPRNCSRDHLKKGRSKTRSRSRQRSISRWREWRDHETVINMEGEEEQPQPPTKRT